MTRYRALLLASACALPLSHVQAQQPRGRVGPARATPARGVSAPIPGGAIAGVQVEGNQRIETGTIRSYMLVQPGDPFDPERIDRSLKTLFATGLFQDVTIRREGASLVVKVVENPIINRIAFEGNRKLTDDQLRGELQLRARAVYTPQLAQADRQRILDRYAKSGRFAATVEAKVIRLESEPRGRGL